MSAEMHLIIRGVIRNRMGFERGSWRCLVSFWIFVCFCVGLRWNFEVVCSFIAFLCFFKYGSRGEEKEVIAVMSVSRNSYNKLSFVKTSALNPYRISSKKCRSPFLQQRHNFQDFEPCRRESLV
jgi:hypothetical protein